MTVPSYLRAGDPIDKSANTHNEFVQAARGFRESGFSGGQPEIGAFSNTVLVKNDTEDDYGFGSILEVTGLTLVNTKFYPFEFQYGPVALVAQELSADLVDDWVSLAQPIKAGEVGHAYLSGVFPTILIFTEDAKWCNPRANGDDPYLVGHAGGEARIIAQNAEPRDEQVETVYAVVEKFGRINNLGLFVGKANAAGTKGNYVSVSRWSTNGYQYSGLEKGAEEDTGLDDSAYARMADVPSGAWLLYGFIDGGLEIIQVECTE